MQINNQIMNTRLGRFFISSILVLSLQSCISYSTFQGAQTVEKGKFNLNCGFVTILTDGGFGGALPEAGCRVGLTDRMDVGVKMLVPGTLFFDAKFELVRAPTTISLDLGYSTFSIKGDDNTSAHSTSALYPMLLIGRENWYMGLKTILLKTQGEVDAFGDVSYEHSSVTPPCFVIGGIVGTGKLRALPELNIYFSGDGQDVLFLPGLGVQYTLFN